MSLASSSKVTIFTVHETTHDGIKLPSTFLSENDAMDYIDYFTDTDSHIYVFKSYCLYDLPPMNTSTSSPKATRPSTTKSTSSSTDKATSTSSPTPKATRSSTRSSTDKSKSKSKATSTPKATRSSTVERDNDTISLSGMVYKSYGKGFLLIPKKSSEYYGRKYFVNGWWNGSQLGWFLKEEFINDIKTMGATKLTMRKK